MKKRQPPTEGLYWLSFVDPDKPEGHAFLGVCIVYARDFRSAGQVAWDLGCNPGGEVCGSLMQADLKIPVEFQDRLLTRHDIDKLRETTGYK